MYITNIYFESRNKVGRGFEKGYNVRTGMSSRDTIYFAISLGQSVSHGSSVHVLYVPGSSPDVNDRGIEHDKL